MRQQVCICWLEVWLVKDKFTRLEESAACGRELYESDEAQRDCQLQLAELHVP